jgi:thiamine-phosphate pyrophosphorylase
MAKKKPVVPDLPFGRLCLITPAAFDPDAFAPTLDEALRSGDVASLIIDLSSFDADRQFLAAERLVPIAQANAVAAILKGGGDLVRRLGADGLHVDGGHAELRRAVDALHPDAIVGAAGLHTRHEAMLAGETDCDYLFFGRLDGDTMPGIFEKALDLAAWWSAVFEIPAIVMGGHAAESVVEAVDARIEFVALREAVWTHAEGAAAAVAKTNQLISSRQPTVTS